MLKEAIKLMMFGANSHGELQEGEKLEEILNEVEDDLPTDNAFLLECLMKHSLGENRQYWIDAIVKADEYAKNAPKTEKEVIEKIIKSLVKCKVEVFYDPITWQYEIYLSDPINKKCQWVKINHSFLKEQGVDRLKQMLLHDLEGWL